MFTLSEPQLELQQSARELAESEFRGRAAEIDRTEEYPWENVRRLTEAGFMGMTDPRGVWWTRVELPRCGARRRADVPRLRAERAYRRRSEHGRHRRHHGLRLGEAEKAG